MGGPNNPPGHVQVITLDDDDAKASAQLTAAWEAGFTTYLGVIEHQDEWDSEGQKFLYRTRVILGNYQKGS